MQLAALADEVFEAAAAQARLGAHSSRRDYGEIVLNPNYPDLFFLNGISNLVAPGWTAVDLQRVFATDLSGRRSLRVDSRDQATIASLGPSLIAAGYKHEPRIAMVHAFTEGPEASFADPGERRFSFGTVEDDSSWGEYERSIRIDAEEHGWRPSMTQQFIELCRWRSAETPHRYYLTYQGGRAVAHAGLFQNGRTAYIHGVYTQPDARRGGLARSLTLYVAAEARALGSDRVTLQCVDDGYLPGYYARLGFRPVGEQQIWFSPA